MKTERFSIANLDESERKIVSQMLGKKGGDSLHFDLLKKCRPHFKIDNMSTCSSTSDLDKIFDLVVYLNALQGSLILDACKTFYYLSRWQIDIDEFDAITEINSFLASAIAENILGGFTTIKALRNGVRDGRIVKSDIFNAMLKAHKAVMTTDSEMMEFSYMPDRVLITIVKER